MCDPREERDSRNVSKGVDGPTRLEVKKYRPGKGKKPSSQHRVSHCGRNCILFGLVLDRRGKYRREWEYNVVRQNARNVVNSERFQCGKSLNNGYRYRTTWRGKRCCRVDLIFQTPLSLDLDRITSVWHQYATYFS